MKKGMFFALAASSLLFSACSSDDAVVSTEGQNEAVQQIVLQVASSGDGLTTRAGRPLYSSQALQTIQNVRVMIYKNETGGGEKTIVYDKKLNWKESTTYNTNGHGRQFTISLKGDDRLEKGSYKVMAVGYSDNSDYTYALDVKGQAALTGSTYSDITATLEAGKVAEEVFAGDADLKIGVDKNITNLTPGDEYGLAVTLHRQVAGSFGYFCNIPAKVDGKTAKTLRLVVRDKNDMLTFKDFNSSFTANGATGSTVKYYVNGSTSTGVALPTTDKFSNGDKGYVLYSINLDTWFPGGDHNNDGVLNAEDSNWKHADGVNTQVVKGSVFGSNFVIPFALAHEKSTMELQLLDNTGDIIKTWTVSIPEVNSNTENGNVADESASIFNVVRNHMYNLGVKTSNGTTTPPDPNKPDPDPNKPDPDKPDPDTDQPEDLTKSQNLILKVNDNWEAIHKLVLGD